MFYSKGALLGLSLLGGVFAATHPAPNDIKSIKSDKLPRPKGAFMVELEADMKVSDALGKREESAHERFYSHLNKRGHAFDIREEFNVPEIFHGASVKFDNPDISLADLQAMPGVKAVFPMQVYQALDADSPHRKRSGWSKHHQLAERMPPKPSVVEFDERDLDSALAMGPSRTELVKRAYPSIPVSRFRNDNFAPHVMTRVNEVHAQGILGKGVKVAVLDTGVDYNHPALGGGFGPGHKISFGMDLVGDNYSGQNKPVPGGTPYDPCGEHGTHVTGIIGADPNEFNFTGVAPYAELGMYRVFGCAPPSVTQDDVLVKGMIMAYQAGADVISLSLGGPNGWTEDAAALVANRINELGSVVTIAAGNSGDEGLYYAQSPASGVRTWSIGSVEVTDLPILRFAETNTGRTIEYLSLYPFNVSKPLPVYATSTNINDTMDACNPLPASTPNLAPYLVVIQRGTCFIDTKYANAAAAGARYVLIANNGNPPFYNDGSGDGLRGAALAPNIDDGLYLRRRFIEGKKTTVSFANHSFTSSPNAPAGGFIDSFSQYGPTFDMIMQPTVSAPGGNILSTFPLRIGGYGIISGTSMATPHTAGAAALLLSAPGKEPSTSTPVRGKFISTGQLLKTSVADSSYITLLHQGGGLIDVYAAIYHRTLVQPEILTLNDTRHFRGTPDIVISNTHTTAKTYKVSHLPVNTDLTFDADSIGYPSVNPESTTDYASVSFSATSFTVPAGGNYTLTAKFTAPTANADRFPLYSGFVVMQTGEEVIKVPYFGLANALYNAQVLDTGSFIEGIDVPFVRAGINQTDSPVQHGVRTYTLTGKSFPTLVLRLLMGTARLRVDLVEANIDFTPTDPDEYNEKRDLESRAQSFGSVPIIGNIPGDSADYIFRNGEVSGDITDLKFTWDGTYVNSSGKTENASTGRYRFLIRVLKITGNPTLESDYESWLSPIIKVERS